MSIRTHILERILVYLYHTSKQFLLSKLILNKFFFWGGEENHCLIMLTIIGT